MAINPIEPCGAINTLRPRQNGLHFPYDIFISIFLDENVWITIKISMKFLPNGPINSTPALIQILVWRRLSDKPLSEPMMLCYWRIYASCGLIDLSHQGTMSPHYRDINSSTAYILASQHWCRYAWYPKLTNLFWDKNGMAPRYIVLVKTWNCFSWGLWYTVASLGWAVVMMTSYNANIFSVTGHLCGEFTGPRWIPRTKASAAELWCFLRSAPE